MCESAFRRPCNLCGCRARRLLYCGLKTTSGPIHGALARWQERRATEILAANLEGNVPLRTLAQEPGLSVRHFSRAFRRSTGMAPHQWLLHKRVEFAMALLRNRRLPLSEVALAAGFANQSHFTRVFSCVVGVTPGIWRRRLDE
jgi:AraC family transcriptional regulator